MTEPFTDAHVHFWDHSLPGMRWRFLEPDFEHPRVEDAAPRRAPYGPTELVAEAGSERADKVVHIQCVMPPVPTPTQETDWLESARRYARLSARDRCRVPTARADAGDVLAANAASPRFRGVRDLSVMAQWNRRSRGRVRCRRLPRCVGGVDAVDGALRLGGRPGRALAGVTIVLGHAGQPLAGARSRLPGPLVGCLAAARTGSPNVVLKLSAIVSSADPDWTVASRARCVPPVIAAFGADRCMFASNWPIDRLYGTYPRSARGLSPDRVRADAGCRRRRAARHRRPRRPHLIPGARGLASDTLRDVRHHNGRAAAAGVGAGGHVGPLLSTATTCAAPKPSGPRWTLGGVRQRISRG